MRAENWYNCRQPASRTAGEWKKLRSRLDRASGPVWSWSVWLVCASVSLPIAAQEPTPAKKDNPLAAEASSATKPDGAGPAGTAPAGGELDVRPCAFQGVTPGETLVDNALEKFGPPAEDSESNGVRLLTFVLEPFAKVELFVEEQVVASVVLHFKAPASPTQIEYELQLREIEATPVRSETGQLLGRAYPERGVLLSYDPEASSHRATQLILEPISAELFLLRVENDRRHRYRRNLADLQTASDLEPNNPEILRWQAKILGRTGERKRAIEVIDQALQRAPLDTPLLLSKAELLLQLDRLDEARDLVQGMIDERPADPLLRARAEKLYGDLLAVGSARHFANALEHHLEAIKLAAPVASDERAKARLAAKELLVECFLAAAHDIAAGEWQEKETTAAKWLASARELTEAMIVQDGGDETLRLALPLAALSVEAELAAGQPLDTTLSTLTTEAQRITDASGDPLFEREVNWQRAQGLFDAATIAHQRDQAGQARELAAQSLKLVQPLAKARELTPTERYLVGRLHFFLGSAAAVSQQDHRAAVKSYDLARKYLAQRPPDSAAFDLGRHGERLVSMGASYFEAGDKELGIRLTRDGLELTREAVAAGMADQSALRVPYGNLAAMSKLQGKEGEARQYAEMAARLGTAREGTRR